MFLFLSYLGVFSNSLNTTVITSSLDGTVRFFDFGKFNLNKVVSFSSPVYLSTYSPESDLFAAVTDNKLVHVLDCETHKYVLIMLSEHILLLIYNVSIPSVPPQVHQQIHYIYGYFDIYYIFLCILSFVELFVVSLSHHALLALLSHPMVDG